MEVLRTERLIIQTWAPDDIDDAFRLWGDPKVMALIDSRGGLARQQVCEKLAAEIRSQDEFGVQYWKVTDKHTGDMIGCCGLRPYDLQNDTYELGFHIVSDQWGRGYASEAARAVIEYAFKTFNINELIAGHHPENMASAHLLQKLEFVYGGDEYYNPTGLHHPSYRLANPIM